MKGLGALLLAMFATVAPVRSAAAIVVHLDMCTPVAVEMIDTVDSKDAAPGDFFRFQTVNAVTSGKTIAIPQRTIGYGVVAVASPAGRSGRAGLLVLEPLYLVMPSGQHLGVVFDHGTDEVLDRSGDSKNAPGYLGAIPIPGIGAAVGAFNYFHNGQNIQVKRGTVFAIFPSNDPDVERCQGHPSY
ncbi:MAG: hypothetical protein ACLQPV_01725 [Vulcanimicrobiaceae bacterium]